MSSGHFKLHSLKVTFHSEIKLNMFDISQSWCFIKFSFLHQHFKQPCAPTIQVSTIAPGSICGDMKCHKIMFKLKVWNMDVEKSKFRKCQKFSKPTEGSKVWRGKEHTDNATLRRSSSFPDAVMVLAGISQLDIGYPDEVFRRYRFSL